MIDWVLPQRCFKICKSLNIIRLIKRSKEKNHTILLINATKAFDKIQIPFMIKAFMKPGVEEMYLSIICQAYSQYHAKWRKTETISLKSGMR
jgi:hypothetical protein